MLNFLSAGTRTTADSEASKELSSLNALAAVQHS